MSEKSNSIIMTEQTKKDTEDKQLKTAGEHLSAREENFCQEVVQGKSITEAYLNAGYKAKNRASASSMASRLFKLVKIKKRIGVITEEVAEYYRLTPSNVIKQTGAILNANVSHYLTWGPAGLMLRPESELTEDQLAAVESITETRTAAGGGTIKFTLHNKLKAAELGARLLKMLDEDDTPKGPIQITVVYEDKLAGKSRKD